VSTVAIPTANQAITGEEFALMEDPDSYELVLGRIVFMAPPPGSDHGGVESNLHGHVFVYLQRHRTGVLRVGESGIYTSRDPDTVRGVDLYFISHERFAQRDRTLKYLDVAPDWITEVLSPSNAEAHVKEKLAEYFAIHVRMVWLIDPVERCVHVYRSLTDVQIFLENDSVGGEDVLPGFTIQVAKLFENL
jgi:Uma2 family endonuclease